MKAAIKVIAISFFLWVLPTGKKAMAQSCQGTVPHYTLNLTGASDSVWSSASVARTGRCCGLANPWRCIHFTVTLDSNSMGVRLDVSGTSTGYNFQNNCGSSTSVGDTMCLTGGGTYELTICVSGASSNQVYTVTSIPKPSMNISGVVVNPGCTKSLVAKGYIESSITWRSATNNSTYNSYLSCLSACDSTVFTMPVSGFPAYVDYIVTGTQKSSKCGSFTTTDTVRIYKNPSATTVNAGSDTTVCSHLNRVNLNGVVTNATGRTWTGRGGNFIGDSTTANPIYVPSSAEISAGSTYLVLTATGGNGCVTIRDTLSIVIYQAPNPTIMGSIKICQGATNSVYSVTAGTGHSYDWHVVGGTMTSGQGTNSVNVTWGNSGPGYIYMIQADANGCQGVGAISTISRFDFNSLPLTDATVGPDATYNDADAYPDGQGYRITTNTGGSKGIDLTVPGAVFDRGKMCMTFAWQRDENEADFFTRGGITYRIRGGALQIGIRINNGSGGYTDIGPLNTGYTVPHDDIFRYFTFCYDSATGKAITMMNDSVVWTYNGTPGRSLYWTGAGSAQFGVIMDGSGNGRPLLDWANISIPVTIIPKPSAVLTGTTPLCQGLTGGYKATDSIAYYSYNWLPNGGTVISGQGTDSARIQWNSSGTRTLTLVISDTINECDSTLTMNVLVNPQPTASITGTDTLCTNTQATYRTPALSNAIYLWSAPSGTVSGASNLDSVMITYTTSGIKTVSLTVIDTISGCSTQVTQQVLVDTLPVGNISGPNPVCMGSVANLYQTASNGLYTYNWNATNGNITSGAGTHAVAVTWPTAGAGNMALTITKAPGGCQINLNYGVTILPKPVLGPIQHQ